MFVFLFCCFFLFLLLPPTSPHFHVLFCLFWWKKFNKLSMLSSGYCYYLPFHCMYLYENDEDNACRALLWLCTTELLILSYVCICEMKTRANHHLEILLQTLNKLTWNSWGFFYSRQQLCIRVGVDVIIIIKRGVLYCTKSLHFLQKKWQNILRNFKKFSFYYWTDLCNLMSVLS